jgi:hypothetical protein
MSQEDKIKLILINEAIELQKQLNELKQTICRNHRVATRYATKSSINNYENYFNTPNQVGAGKMYMINPKHIEELREKPYSRTRKQLNPNRGICSKVAQNSVIQMPNSKAIDSNFPGTDYLLPLYNTSCLIEMTADEVNETLLFCEQEITPEQLEDSMMYVLPELNLEEARQLLKVIDWMKF